MNRLENMDNVLYKTLSDYDRCYIEHKEYIRKIIMNEGINIEHFLKQKGSYIEEFFYLVDRVYGEKKAILNEKGEVRLGEIIVSHLINEIAFYIKNKVNIEQISYFYDYSNKFNIIVNMNNEVIGYLKLNKNIFERLENPELIKFRKEKEIINKKIEDLNKIIYKKEEVMANPLAFGSNSPLETLKIMSNIEKFRKNIKKEIDIVLNEIMELKMNLNTIENTEEEIIKSNLEKEYIIDKFRERLFKIGIK